MLQRIQTIYMLGSVISILMMLLLPLGTIATPEATFDLSALGISSVTEEIPLDVMRYPLLLLLLVMFALPLVCIFLYNKRKIQLRILIYTALIDLLFYAYFFLFEAGTCQEIVIRAMQENGIETTPEMSYQSLLFVMPLVSVFCCVMAFRGVTFDIALLASADRLRPSRK